MKQRISETYLHLTGYIGYNQSYALKYPEEDRTNLESQYNQIVELLSELQLRLKSQYKLQQLELAAREIEAAFHMYRKGEDGYEKLESALEYIARSKRKGPPKTNFIAGADGVIKL